MSDFQELSHRQQQNPIIVERASMRQFDMSKKAKIEGWFADVLFQDFLKRKGVHDRKGNV